MEAIAPPDKILDKHQRRRRWWIGIVFALLGIGVVVAVALSSKPPPPPYAFLKGSKLDWSDEYIGPGVPHRMMYVRSHRSTVDQPYSIVGLKAEKELTARGFSVMDRRDDFVWIQNASDGWFVVLMEERGGTLVHWSTMRPYNTFDRVRLWLKSLLPSKEMPHEQAVETK